MTFADDIRTVETGIVHRMRASVEQARRSYAQHREFKRTYNELSKLTERELDDLGIARANIAEIARSSVSQN